jgi:hypothetical protein
MEKVGGKLGCSRLCSCMPAEGVPASARFWAGGFVSTSNQQPLGVDANRRLLLLLRGSNSFNRFAFAALPFQRCLRRMVDLSHISLRRLDLFLGVGIDKYLGMGKNASARN